MNKYELKHYRAIKVKFLPATNFKPHRIKIWEEKRREDDPTPYKILSLDNDINDVVDQAIDVLTRAGFTPVCRATEWDYYTILCDNYGEDFKLIKDLK